MHLKSAIIFFTFFILLFLHFLLLVDPRIVYHVQEPAFLMSAEFFNDFIGYPGGLAWYASAFLTQLYQFPWPGALVMTLVVFLVYWQATLFFRFSGIKGLSRVAGVMPALALFAAMNDYRFPLSYAISLIVALLAANGYLFRLPGSGFARILRYGVLSIVVYVSVGTGALLFMVLCGLYELLFRKSYPVSAVMAGFGAALPFLAANFFFVISLSAAYGDFIGLKTNLLAAAHYPRMPVVVYVAYLLFPAVLIAGCIASQSGVRSIQWKNRFDGFAGSMPGLLVLSALLLITLAGTALFALDVKAMRNYRIDYFARNRMWHRIVQAMPPERLDDYTILSQMHLFRALYYENRLLSDLFTYPHALPGKAFMAITGQMTSLFPVQMSDCCFEVGALNQAEFWAHEALSVQGKKPWILRRLALINMMKARNISAEKFLALLEKTPYHSREVNRCRHLLEKGSFDGGDGYLKDIRSYMPGREYLCGDYYSELVNLFECNSGNRIAFEYIVAQNLMNNFVTPVIDNTGYFAQLGYRELPRHVQEAAALQLSLSGSEETMISGFHLDNGLFQSLNRFNQLMYQSGSDRDAALNACNAEYGSTYWYYLMSSKKPVILRQNK